MTASSNTSPLFQLVPFLLMFLVFYLLVIKPQKKEREELRKKINALKKNDPVITAGGLHGTVVNIKEKTIILRVDDNVKLEFDKEAITKIEDSH